MRLTGTHPGAATYRTTNRVEALLIINVLQHFIEFFALVLISRASCIDARLRGASSLVLFIVLFVICLRLLLLRHTLEGLRLGNERVVSTIVIHDLLKLLLHLRVVI